MLRIENLSAGYEGQEILHEVSLDAPQGQVTALLGPNGAGKSTLLRTVSGVIAPRRGRVSWCGADILQLSPAQRARLVAVVPQRAVLPSAFTVWQAVMMGRTPYLNFLGQPSPQDEAVVRSALARTELLPFAERRVDDLSGGEQQRVLLARALAQEAPLLLLDEPVTYLDLMHQMQLMALLRDIVAERALTVLMVLHDINLAARIADQAVLLRDGRIFAQGAVEAVFTAETLTSLYGWPLSLQRVAGQMVAVAA